MAEYKKSYVTVDEALAVLTSGITAEKVEETSTQSSAISEQVATLEDKVSVAADALSALTADSEAIKEALAAAVAVKYFETTLTDGALTSSADEEAGTITYVIDWAYTGAEMAEALDYAMENEGNLVSAMAYCGFCSSTNIAVNNLTGELSTRLFFDLGMNTLASDTPFTWDAFFSISSAQNFSTGARLRYTIPAVYSQTAATLNNAITDNFTVMLRIMTLSL